MARTAQLLRKSFDASNERVAELEERVDDLEHEVESLKKQLQIQGVHAEDDLHRIRVRVLKSLTPEIDRLRDMLVANSRTPPKTHIVDQYGKDVLEAVTNVVSEMQKRKNGPS